MTFLAQTFDPLTPTWHAARAGDALATRELVRVLSPIMARAARGVLGHNHESVDDACQIAMLATLRALKTFREEAPLSHFASRVAVRTALTIRRAHSRRRRYESEWGTHQAASVDCVLDPKRAVERVLARLSDVQAETVALRCVLELSLEETAEATGVPLNTVRSRLRLAREAIEHAA